MRFGCCAVLDRIQTIQDAGYDFIELPVGIIKVESPYAEFEPVRDEIRSYDIIPEAWNCMLPGDLKVTGPEVDKYRIERYLRTALERIEELGGEIIGFGSGMARRVPDGFPQKEAKEQVLEFVTLAGQIAGTHGITIAIEPLGRKDTNVINLVSEALEIARAANHPFVRVLADLHHMQECGESIQSLIAANGELAHTHVADTDRFYPGSGSYPYVEFFESLSDIGYDDRVSVECSWRDFESECAKALEFLRGLEAEMPY